jgi:hypothetical protein
VLEALLPQGWRAFWGVVVFFILPEAALYVWGEDLREWLYHKSVEAPTLHLALALRKLADLCEPSLFWFLVGVGLAGWFLYSRAAKRRAPKP